AASTSPATCDRGCTTLLPLGRAVSATGASPARAALIEPTAGRSVYSTSTSSSASSASAADTATTAASGSPTKCVQDSGNSRLAATGGIDAAPTDIPARDARSAAVTTATTPGAARAALTWIDSMRACAN